MNREAIRTGLLFVGLWLLLVIAGRSKFFQDPGTFWHVAVGERLAAEGFFRIDPYSFTFQGAEWIPHQWFGELSLAGAYRLGGLDLMLVLATGILAAIFTALGKRLLDIGLHPSVVAVLLATALACSSGHFHVRPHLATIAGFAILLCLLSGVERGTRSVACLFWFVPVCWIWSNIHGGVLGGLATLGFVLGGWTIQYMAGCGPFRSSLNIGQAALVMLACVASCFVNPYGWRLPASWLVIYRMESLPGIIQEHRPMDFTAFGWQGIVAFAFVYVAAVVLLPLRQWRVTYLVPLIWLMLTFTRVRHAPLFAVTAMVAFADLFPQTRLADWLVRKKNDMFTPPDSPVIESKARAWLAPGLVILIAGCAAVVLSPADRIHPFWVRLDPQIWPIEALPEVRKAAASTPQQPRIFAEYHYGGFLILQEPRCLVFIDDRCELYGDQFLEEYVLTKGLLGQKKIQIPGKPLDDWQEKYGPFDFALVTNDEGFDLAFASQKNIWQVLHRDENTTLYGRLIPVK
ncbi:hypothetical protein [Zavarzinella formosa]|uniref:hypothetical protein n=1 Tax=Zavarzinella formosa TaxID=360055 RepID=UPI0002E9A388|nr:hypothetical protein [Zavarzinella formosa]